MKEKLKQNLKWIIVGVVGLLLIGGIIFLFFKLQGKNKELQKNQLQIEDLMKEMEEVRDYYTELTGDNNGTVKEQNKKIKELKRSLISAEYDIRVNQQIIENMKKQKEETWNIVNEKFDNEQIMTWFMFRENPDVPSYKVVDNEDMCIVFEVVTAEEVEKESYMIMEHAPEIKIANEAFEEKDKVLVFQARERKSEGETILWTVAIPKGEATNETKSTDYDGTFMLEADELSEVVMVENKLYFVWRDRLYGVDGNKGTLLFEPVEVHGVTTYGLYVENGILYVLSITEENMLMAYDEKGMALGNISWKDEKWYEYMTTEKTYESLLPVDIASSTNEEKLIVRFIDAKDRTNPSHSFIYRTIEKKWFEK